MTKRLVQTDVFLTGYTTYQCDHTSQPLLPLQRFPHDATSSECCQGCVGKHPTITRKDMSREFSSRATRNGRVEPACGQHCEKTGLTVNCQSYQKTAKKMSCFKYTRGARNARNTPSKNPESSAASPRSSDRPPDAYGVAALDR